MTIAIEIGKSPVFKDPKWSTVTALPGKEVQLSVTASDLLAGQTVHFEVRNAANRLLSILDADRSHSQKWTTPAAPEDATYSALAVLRQKPIAANGHQTVWRSVKVPASLAVKGTKLTISKIDAAFVPKQEKLEATYKIEGIAPAKGRIEVWGERYPTKKPVYVEAFKPAAEEKVWNTWFGGVEPKKKDDPKNKVYGGGITEEGPLKAKYLTPEFSPYRLRIVLGPDDEAIKEPLGKGLGKVVIAETQFEVTYQSLYIRLQKDLNEQTADKDNRLASVLGVEPRAATGEYAALGRLPKANEHGRIRIPTARYYRTGEALDQGQVNTVGLGRHYSLNANYMSDNSAAVGGGVGRTKHAIEADHYSRPAIPLEFELRLKSRDTAKNAEAAGGGLHERDAVGPAIIEPVVADFFQGSLYTGGNATFTEYWRKATFMVKRGTHTAPQRNGANPIVSYWLARFVVQAPAGTPQTRFATNAAANANRITDPAFKWAATKAKDELIVYINRAKLVCGSNDDFTKKKCDFKELNDHEIELQAGLTKANDILWIARCDSTIASGHADEDTEWGCFPLGTNCPPHYGGIRGEEENNLWLDDWPAAAAGNHQPVIGRSADAYPYADHMHVDLEPDCVPIDADQERAKVQAMCDGAKKGLAGILFSPSYVAGDSYVIKARLEKSPFRRSFGDLDRVTRTPWMEPKTGDMTVWRLNRITQSLRLPDRGAVGLNSVAPNQVGSQPDNPMSGRAHLADGYNMNFQDINNMVDKAFNEWAIGDPKKILKMTKANPIRMTSPGHGLSTGDNIRIHDVKAAKGTGAAVVQFNGTFVVRKVDNDTVTLHSTYAFGQPDGVGAGANGAGAVADFDVTTAITAATKEAPIKITANGHGLANGNEVLIQGVQGNVAANGTFKVTRADANTFTLDGSDGTESGDYTANSGTVYNPARCGRIDVHIGVNLKAYRDAYVVAMTAEGLGGTIPMNGPGDVKNEIVPWDHYRVRLPPGIPNNRLNVARNTINGLAAGTYSDAAGTAVAAAITAWQGAFNPATGNNWGAGRPDAALGGGVPNIPESPTGGVAPWTATRYKNWVSSSVTKVFRRIIQALTPRITNVKDMTVMKAVRWPKIGQDPVWYNHNPYQETDVYTAGMCLGSGQSFFESHPARPAPGLFEHEEQHAIHLVHFSAGNFGWKHHDQASQNCRMSYEHTNGIIVSPAAGGGPTVAGTPIDKGWPHRITNPPPPPGAGAH